MDQQIAPCPGTVVAVAAAASNSPLLPPLLLKLNMSKPKAGSVARIALVPGTGVRENGRAPPAAGVDFTY